MSYETIAHEIDTNKTKFIDRLRTAVEIPSISADPEHREDVFRMIDWAQKQMETLGIKCEQIENGVQKLDNGQTLKLPPVLFGTLETSTHPEKHKKTLLVYGHLDVQPARLADGWNTEPFQLVEKDDKLYGRGSTDDKGPILAWLNAIETMQHLKIDIPVNIKFVLEGMEESGSEGLDDILKQHQHTFLADVDMVCISDNYWLGKKKPCITYGLRGLCYYAIEISEPKQDLHSGVFGGTIHEPMNDLVWIMSRLQDLKGKILIDGIYDLVAPLTKEEEKTYDAIDFDLENYKQDLGVNKLTYDTKNEVLMYRWRFPSLSIHGIEGAFSGSGAKTVIPAKVVGKFSIRLVPDMEPEKVDKLVIDYLNKVWKERGSPAKFKPIVMQGAKSWVEDFKHPHYQAGARALKKVFGVDPDFVREGCSIPVTLTFQELTKKNVMLLPIGACDDMAHSQNEKINISNYIEGTKALAAYLLELAHV